MMICYVAARNQVITRNMLEHNKDSIMADSTVSKHEPLKMSSIPFYLELSQSAVAPEEYQLYVDAFPYSLFTEN